MNNPSLIFKFSPELETARLLDFLSKIDWYKKMGYRIDLLSDSNAINLKNISEEELKNLTKREYNESDYSKAANLIKEKWLSNSEKIKRLFATIFPNPSYDIFLTKYGTGGSYELPNKIIINFQRKSPEFLLLVLLHEMTHLSIESLIQKYKINHWTKERIVDLILQKTIPEINRIQKIPIDTIQIDELFEKEFPNLEILIEKISLKEQPIT